MVKKLKTKLKIIRVSRIAVLAILFCVLTFTLLQKLFSLQIVNGESYRNNFQLQTRRERTIKSTRGNIYDRNGNVLASNEMSYSVTLEDNGSYDSTRIKNLSLNGEALKICQILEANGDSLTQDFHVIIDGGGNYSYSVSGTSLLRFKADVYGYAAISDLTSEQENATAEAMMDYLISEERFAIIRTKEPYTNAELTQYGLPNDLTKEQLLKIVSIRYALSTTSYQKYVPVTIATNVSNESVAALKECQDNLTGINVEEDTIRVYNDAEYFAPLIGYTGKVSAEDLATLQEKKSSYSSTSIVGRTGIEQYMETTLQGSDGSETVYVDNLGKVLQIDENSRLEPISGNDVYLSIDKELQIATYKILEQRIAGILSSIIIDAQTFDKTAITDSSQIKIPSYDVYTALISNRVVDTSHFKASDASGDEQALLDAYTHKQSEVFGVLQTELTGANPTSYNQLSPEMQEYMTYIVDDLLTSTTEILSSSAIDTEDATYKKWNIDGSISLQEYLTYAASQNWINISDIMEQDAYVDSKEVYQALAEYITNYLSTDDSFGNLLYKYLLQEKRISPDQIFRVLYDQGVLSKEDGQYNEFIAGTLSTYDLMVSKVNNLGLTPAQLALDPCTGSAVVTDPNTGEILACVTYPGYDNNKLANSMDVNYYNKLSSDLSEPFYNKATQERTAPGSTFKPVTAVAGLEDRVITPDTVFHCSGVFNLTETPISCWNKTGHGDLTVQTAIAESCNVFFSNVAYKLGTDETGAYRDSLSLQKNQTYAKLFNLDKKSGIEISEVEPQISTQDGIRSAFGQGTHSYTTTQLARYVTSIANTGTSYNLSVLDKVTDSSGNLIEDYSPNIETKISISDSTWNIVHSGMREVISENPIWDDVGIAVAGKTGTAQESKVRPDHGLFIGYAPYESPQIACAVRITHGYSSTNASLVAKDVIKYYFNLADESAILTGNATTESVSNEQTD